MNAPALSLEDKTDIARLVVAELRTAGLVAPRIPVSVLTLKEAMTLTKKNSTAAFYAWDKAWGPTGCGHGRYGRARIERALEREARA